MGFLIGLEATYDTTCRPNYRTLGWLINRDADGNARGHKSLPATAAQDPSKTATYTGKIVSQNGVRFILRDETNNTWYHLDDQQQAGKFLGKTVLVVGVLDGPTNTIRVKSIAEAKS
jgi:Protein of unknown function (DUF5818)